MRTLTELQGNILGNASHEREDDAKCRQQNKSNNFFLAPVVTLEDEEIVDVHTTCHDNTTISTSSTCSVEDTKVDLARVRFEAIAATRVGEYIASSFSDNDDDEDKEDIRQWSLDDFEILQKLGEGGVATVYEAKEITSGYHVALKAQTTEDGLADMEIGIHQELRHPNIVGFLDYFFSDSFFGKVATTSDTNDGDNSALPGRRYVYSILEICRGGSLYDVITRQPQGRLSDEALAARWMKSAIEGIQYMHALGILHCDVKTANFVIGESNVLKVTDFGFSVRVEEGSEEEVEGGSLLYMAPEHLIAWRDGHACNTLQESVDVYGLGCVLFEVLVGELPYAILEEIEEGETLEEAMEDLVSCWDDCEFRPHVTVLESIDENTVLPLPVFPDFVSLEAQDLLKQLLHSNPSERITLHDALEHPWFLQFNG
jgi:serine/threonine protein kinase